MTIAAMLRSMTLKLARRLTGRLDEGLAAIEFALLVPVYLFILIGSVDMGGMLYSSYKLDQAVAAGAQYAVVNAANVNSTNGAALASSIAGIVENANGSAWANDTIVVNDGPSVTISSGSSSASGTASNADSCYCPTGSPPNWVWGSAATCASSCSGGAGQAGKFVTITATVTYTPLLTTYGLIPNNTLTQNATVQVQ